MIKRKCKKKGCGKIVEGYSVQHAELLLSQHMIKHEHEERKNKTGVKKKNGNK